MAISQKCQYALRAIYELALHQDEGPCKIGAIAEAQSIPVRFLENILNSLKGAGFVDSVRGKDGGYYLLRKADEITVGEVIRFVQGPLGRSNAPRVDDDCDFTTTASSGPVGQGESALESVYDGTRSRISSISPQILAGCLSAAATEKKKI